jgi:hypothetical protein
MSDLTLRDYLRYEIVVTNSESVLHCYQDGDLYTGDLFEDELHYIDSFDSTNYLAWLAQGNPAPTPTIIPTPDPLPKYETIPVGILPMDWRRYLYTLFVDPHVMASTSYTLEGETTKADAEKVIALSEKAAIRLAFPDIP